MLLQTTKEECKVDNVFGLESQAGRGSNPLDFILAQSFVLPDWVISLGRVWFGCVRPHSTAVATLISGLQCCNGLFCPMPRAFGFR